MPSGAWWDTARNPGAVTGDTVPPVGTCRWEQPRWPWSCSQCPRLQVLPAVPPKSHTCSLGTRCRAGRWLRREHAGRAVARSSTCPAARPGDAPASESQRCVTPSSMWCLGQPPGTRRCLLCGFPTWPLPRDKRHGDGRDLAWHRAAQAHGDLYLHMGEFGGHLAQGARAQSSIVTVALCTACRGGLRCPHLHVPLDLALQLGDAQGARGEHEMAICLPVLGAGGEPVLAGCSPVL